MTDAPPTTADRAPGTPESGVPESGRPHPEPGRGFDRLHPSAITLWRLAYAFRGALFVAFAVAGDFMADLPLPTGLPAFVLAVIAIFVAVLVPPARYRAWGYRLRSEDLFLRHGILFRTTTIVPHARIQHVDTRHGPVDRWLGLASVVVFTAGTRGAVITIPALGATDAETLRDRLAALSGAGDAV